MGIIASYDPSPLFPDDVQVDVTAGLDVLWSNARLFDMLSLRGRDAFQDNAYRYDGGGANGGTNGDNPLKIWDGGFRFRTGLTTLTLSFVNTLSGGALSEAVRLYLNGTLVSTTAATAGSQTIAYSSLATRGYTDGQVIEVRVELYTAAFPTPPTLVSGQPAWGVYYLVDAYVSPLSGVSIGTWPGVPTFTTALDGAKLNQLSAAADWLAARINLQPMPLFQSLSRVPGLYFLSDLSAVIPQPLWQGGVIRASNDRLRIVGNFQIVTNLSETITVQINGSTVLTLGPYAAGQSGPISATIDISAYSSTLPLRLAIFANCLTPNSDESASRPSRFSFARIWVERASPPYATMPTRSTPEESMTWATLKTRLNGLATLLSTIQSRIVGDSEWDRARLYRSNYGYDDGQKSYYATRHRGVTLYRTGARLVVRGKDVKIGWGKISGSLADAKEPDGETTYTYGYTETLISGDTVQTTVVGLDTYAGLGVGAAYALIGADVRYAGEELL